MIDFLPDEDVDNLKFLADRYHWSSEKKRSTDYQYLENAYHASLPVIGSALNDAHKIHRDCKYWETVIGYWLVVYISVMFDRFEMLKDIHSSSRINEYANETILTKIRDGLKVDHKLWISFQQSHEETFFKVRNAHCCANSDDD